MPFGLSSCSRNAGLVPLGKLVVKASNTVTRLVMQLSSAVAGQACARCIVSSDSNALQ
jgi:hypothetical protein